MQASITGVVAGIGCNHSEIEDKKHRRAAKQKSSRGDRHGEPQIASGVAASRQTNASWDDVVGEDRLSNRGAFREETPEHYGGRLTKSFDEYEDDDDDSFVEIDEEDEVEKILNTYLKPAEQRHAHVQQRRSSLCGRDLAKIHEDYHANDGANLEEDDHEDLHHAIVNDDDHAFVHGQIEEIYAARVKADLDAVKEKLAKTEGELDAERQEKLELATKSAEQAREIAELNLFLKKAEKLLVEVRKRDASDPSKGQPKEGFGSHRANQQEDAHRRAMEETINMANAMKKSKVHQAAATVKSLIRMEGPAAEIKGFQMANRTEPTQAAAGDLEITGHKSKHIDEEGDDEPIPLNSILEELRRSKFTRPQKETSKQDAALADAGRELAAVRDALINDMREGLHEQLGRMPATAARTAKLFDKQANALEHLQGAPPAMPTRIIKVGAKKKKGRNSAKGFKGFVPPGAMLPGQDNGRQSMKADAPHEEPPPTAAPPPEPGV
jgi:hypothetical protein